MRHSKSSQTVTQYIILVCLKKNPLMSKKNVQKVGVQMPPNAAFGEAVAPIALDFLEVAILLEWVFLYLLNA